MHPSGFPKRGRHRRKSPTERFSPHPTAHTWCGVRFDAVLVGRPPITVSLFDVRSCVLPNLLLAASACVFSARIKCTRRAQVYTRLAINLKHLKQPGRRQLEVVRDACEDEDVRGGERMELRERYRKLQRDHGT